MESRSTHSTDTNDTNTGRPSRSGSAPAHAAAPTIRLASSQAVRGSSASHGDAEERVDLSQPCAAEGGTAAGGAAPKAGSMTASRHSTADAADEFFGGGTSAAAAAEPRSPAKATALAPEVPAPTGRFASCMCSYKPAAAAAPAAPQA